MSNEFDIEKARAGEPVECLRDCIEYFLVHFIGTDLMGNPVVQEIDTNIIFPVLAGHLRMAPKKIKVRYRVALLCVFATGYRVIAANSADEASACEERGDFIRWLTDWQEAEIEQ